MAVRWRRVCVTMLASAVILWAAFTGVILTGDRYLLVYPTVAVEPRAWTVLEGEGGLGEDGFELTMFGPRRYALAGANLPEPVQADSIRAIEMELDPDGGYFDVMFGWSLSQTLSGFRTHSVYPDDRGHVHLDTRDLVGWEGEIHYLLLRSRGNLNPPLVIRSLELVPAKPSFRSFQARLFGEWFSFRHWNQISANRTPVADDKPVASPVLAVAAWAGLSILLLVVGRARAVTPWVLVIVFAAGWLFLDLRWQAELVYKAHGTVKQYAGKSWEEKWLSDIDAPEFEFVKQLKALLPDPHTTRVFILSDHDFTRLRARYHAVPIAARAAEDELRAAQARHFQSGDWLVLLGAPGIEREQAEFGEEAPAVIEFGLSGSVGRDAGLIRERGSESLFLEDGPGQLLAASLVRVLQEGYYRAGFDLQAASAGQRVRVRVRQRRPEGDWATLAERDFRLSGGEYERVWLYFPVVESGRIRVRVDALDDGGYSLRSGQIEPVSEDDRLIHLWSEDLGPFIVGRIILESPVGLAVEVQ